MISVPRRTLAALMLPLALSSGSPVIDSIEIRGEQKVPEETLRFYLGLEAGQPLDETSLNRHIKKLWEHDLVDDVQVESIPTPAGVRLVVTVSERPTLRSITYEGLKRISKTDLQDRMVTQRIRIRAREGETLSLGELQRIKSLIEEMYGEKGYRFATARLTVEDVGPNEKRATFTVDEGDRVRISDIGFEGNTVYNDLRLRLTLKKTKETGLITRFNKKDVYDPAKLQEDLDKIRDLYRGAGYKNVVIGDPKIEVRETGPKRRMFLTLPIEEGDRWKFGEVSIEGNSIYTDQALLRAFQDKAGGWLRSKVIDDGVKQISDLYHNTGYIFARVTPELVEREGRVADLVVRVTEGEQFKVGRIEFAGNEQTKDKVLRRELRLYEGGLMNVAAIRNSILKINQLGYFKMDEEDPVEIDTDTQSKRVHLLFKGEESDRTELQFGGGWSEPEGFFGQFAVSTRNFLGRGEQFAFSLRAGSEHESVDFSYAIPWFLDRPQTLGIRVFDQALEYGDATDLDYYERDGQGTVLTYGRNLRLFQSASVSYNLSRYDDRYNVLLNDGTPAKVQALTHNSSLRPAYVYDNRDNPFETNRGRRLSLAVEYAGGVLGGNNYFVRPEVAFSFHRPMGRQPVGTVLAFNVEGGWIDPFGGYEISALERYRLGGERSLRGHRNGSIYLREPDGDPRRDESGAVLGGDSYAQLNLEYHFLLGGPFRLLLFADAANVFGEDQPFDLSDLRTTAGVELRVLLPVFGAPLRFIYAKNLDPRPQDEFEAFQFSIGTSF